MKSGDKFIFQGKTYTAESFFGTDGVEYQNSKDVTSGNCCVKNKEYGGACLLKYCKPA